MADLFQGIVLAIVAFLLGLVGDAIKKANFHRKKRITYTRRKIPIIAQSNSLPKLVLDKILEKDLFNLVQFQVVVVNTGRKSVSNVNLLIKPNEDAKIIDYTISTDPPELVKYSKIDNGERNNIHVERIYLRTKQSIFFDIYLESKEDPTLDVIWSNEDDVGIVEGPVGGIFSLEESLIGIIKNYIFAIISPGLIVGIFYFLGSSLLLFTGSGGIGSTLKSSAINIGLAIGNLVSLYFYLKLIPYILSLVRNFIKHRDYDRDIEKSITGVVRNFIFAKIFPQVTLGILNLLLLLPVMYIGGNVTEFVNSFGNLIGNLVGLYYYLRIIPYAITLVRELSKHKIKGSVAKI